MDCSVLETSTLFCGMPAIELRNGLETTPHRIQCYDKDETIFHIMDPAVSIGILLEGRVQAQKPFPNGNQINVSVRTPGEMIGPAAVFSSSQKFPCDVVALEPVTMMMFYKEDLLALMQKNIRILKNFTTEIASATYMLQQRLELLSYNGISQKAAFWLLMKAKQSGKSVVQIPDSVSKWAMILNVSRPSLHRELNKMKKQGLIRYNPRVIEIIDAKALQDLLT